MRIMYVLPAIMVMLLLLGSNGSVAQTSSELSELRTKIESLEETQETILDRVKGLEDLLKRNLRPTPPAAQEAGLLLRGAGDDPYLGSAEADLILIEFSDYQCPYCRRHAKEVLPELQKKYLKNGTIKYVFRDFPLSTMHPHATKAAEAAHCAGDQGKYWEMHDRLFENARALSPAHLRDYANDMGLDMQEFVQCLDDDKYAEEVKQDMSDASAAGVTGTPTFFLAVPGDEPGTAKTLKKIVGAQTFEVISAAIDAAVSDLSEGAIVEGEGN